MIIIKIINIKIIIITMIIIKIIKFIDKFPPIQLLLLHEYFI